MEFDNIATWVKRIEAVDWITSNCIIMFLCFTCGIFNVIFTETD